MFFVVSIAFGLLFQFNSAFKSYADNYFGNYLACILEYGELPSLGGGPSIGCDAEFEEFSLANGRPAKGFQGYDKDGATDVADKGDKAGPEREQQDVSGRGNNNSAPFGSGRSRSGSGGRGGRSGTRVGANAASEGDDSGEGDMIISNQNKEGSKYKATDVERRRIPMRLDEVDPENKKEKVKVSKKDDQGGPVIKDTKRLPVREPSASKKISDEDNAIDFGFGGFLRILFIAAIIIALFILLGSQGLQISKEWE